VSGWRAFIAAELTPELLGALGPALESLGAVSALRASAPQAIHLTLHFLGSVDPGRLDELAERAAPVVALSPPFEAVIRGVGAFPSLRRPQVLYAGVEQPEGEPLLALQGAIAPVIAGLGLPLESRPFRPHLTLARARRRLDRDEMAGVEAWSRRWAAARFGPLPIRELALLRSELGGGPPRYTTLRRLPLQGKETAARRI
jgi:RNA 2',3'-cyclic 3'-phosphodiesterase